MESQMSSPPFSREFVTLLAEAIADAGVGSYKDRFLDSEKKIPHGGLTDLGLQSSFFVANPRLGHYINVVGIDLTKLPSIVFGPAYTEADFIAALDLKSNPTWLSRKRLAVDAAANASSYSEAVAQGGGLRRLWGDSDSDSESVSAADKHLNQLNKMIKGIKRLDTDNKTVEVPRGFIPTMGVLGQTIMTAAKLVGVTIKDSSTAFIAVGNTIIPKLSVENPELREEETLLVELIRGLHAVRPLDANATKAELALAYIYGAAYQRFHFDMNTKSVAPCLKANQHHIDNVMTALNKISPRSDEFGLIVMKVVNVIISAGVAKQVAAAESMHHFLDPDVWETYISSLYVSDSTLVEKLFPVATKKRLTREAKKKANNPGFKPRDKDYETYQGVVKPEIDVSRVTLAADEKVAVKAINKHLQNSASGFEYQQNNFNQVNRKKAAMEYISRLQSKAKAVTAVAQRRKGLVHARIVSARSESGDEAKHAPSREEWDLQTQNELQSGHKVLDAIREAFGDGFLASLVGNST
jgi:hypothetical protein